MPLNLTDLVEEIEDPKLKAKARNLLRKNPRSSRGFVATSDDRGNVGWIPWQQATAQGPTGESVLTSPKFRQQMGLPHNPIVKRSDRERVESLAKRFWDTIKDNPSMAPLILKELQQEYWKAGQPVSYEDMRIAAVELLKKAAINAKKGK